MTHRGQCIFFALFLQATLGLLGCHAATGTGAPSHTRISNFVPPPESTAPVLLMYDMLVLPERDVVVVAVRESPTSICSARPPRHLEAVSITSGETLWRRPSGHETPVHVFGDGILVTDVETRSFLLVDARTGEAAPCSAGPQTLHPAIGDEARAGLFVRVGESAESFCAECFTAPAACSGVAVSPELEATRRHTVTVATFEASPACRYTLSVEDARSATHGPEWGITVPSGLTVRLEDHDSGEIPEACMRGDASDACLNHHMIAVRRADGTLVWERQWGTEPKYQVPPP